MRILTSFTEQSSQATVAQNTNWLKLIASPPNATLDIVAVHGMNLENSDGHADNTWTDKESGKNWLEDLLPSSIPNARILAYQYNANVAFGTSSAGVEEQARNMLCCLWAKRKTHNSRPIIFIAHSMGGIIVKEALATAYRGDGTYAMISAITYGIVFFAVPHGGSRHATWGKIVARIAGIFSCRLNESFLSSVESNSAYNEMLNARFKPLLESYQFFSFCETLPEGKLGVIVDRDSAILGLTDRQEVKIFPNRSHRTICKFASGDEPEWTQVSDILCHASNSAVRSFSYSPTVLERKKMFRDLSWHFEEEEIVSIPQAIERSQKVLNSLKEDSESSIQIRVIQKDTNHLNTIVMTLVTCLWSILQPILLIVATFNLVPSFLPKKATIMDKAEEARRCQQESVELQRLAIEALDAQRNNVFQAIATLRNSSSFESLQGEVVSDADRALLSHLQEELDKKAETLVSALHDHHKSYSGRQARLKLIEDSQKEADGKDGREFWLWAAEKAEKENAKSNDHRPKEGNICC